MTWFHYRNYGTALQVSAICKYFRDKGHTVEVIYYMPQKKGDSYVSSYNFIDIINKHRKRAFMKSLNHKPEIRGAFVHSSEVELLYENYLQERINFTAPCNELSELQNLNAEFDAFVCGSDQIWAPNIFDPHYFLDFVSDTEKMVAYAPSIGLFSIEDKFVAEKMRALIGRFKYLSIREKQGADIICKSVGKKALITVDPTLLLTGEEWYRYGAIKRLNKEPYVIVYLLGGKESHYEIAYTIAKKRKQKVKIIPVFENDVLKEDAITEPIGPSEFLSWIYGAEYVITDSFHGTVFSLIFQKNFSVIERFDSASQINQNSRIYSILGMLNLEERLIPYNGSYRPLGIIDYSKVETTINKYRTYSQNFLLSSLSKIEKADKVHIKHILKDNTLCCGCGVCAYVCPKRAITIRTDAKGFRKARVDEDRCINCGKCRDVCVFEGKKVGISLKKATLYSYKDNDNEVLMRSSSGGAAYSISKLLIGKGYNVCGCTYDEQTRKAKHIVVHKEEELYKLQGSKYIQSRFDHVLEQIGRTKAPMLIIGTPCQIAAIKKAFPQQENIICVDLICHGVPSNNLFTCYRKHLRKKYSFDTDYYNIYFRNKEKGWRERFLYSTDGKKSVCLSQHKDLFFRMFESMNCYMEACYNCRWRDNSCADLRLGDYWGPKFENDNSGVSMVVSFTKRGEEIVRGLQKKNCGTIIEQPMSDYLNYQQIENTVKPLYYEEIMKELQAGADLQVIVDKYVVPHEHVVMDKRERLVRQIRLLMYDNFTLKRGDRKNDT